MKKVELYSVAELKKYKNGFMLYRYPSNVISHMGFNSNKKGRDKAKIPAMCELVYHTKEDFFELELESYDCTSEIFVFVNDFQAKKFILKKKTKEKIKIEVNSRLKEHLRDLNFTDIYSYKIVFSNNSRIILYDVECELKEYKKQYLLYGSSISQGAGASDIIDSYAYILKEELHINLLNKSLSSSCLLEKEVIDYLATLNVDGYIFEIGCNVRGVMDKYEFSKRFTYLIDKFKLKNKPIIVISILDAFENMYKDFIDIPYHQKNVDFIKIIKNKIKKENNKNIYLISGKKLLLDIQGISFDLLHPSNIGHKMIAMNLSKQIKKKLGGIQNGTN